VHPAALAIAEAKEKLRARALKAEEASSPDLALLKQQMGTEQGRTDGKAPGTLRAHRGP
jgi:hypothetical protein